MRKESVAPKVMVAGAAGTIGSRLCAALDAMGCLLTPVMRKEYDLRVEGEFGVALLAAKPDIVIQATSSLEDGAPSLFRSTMGIGMNLVHGCAAAGTRLVQLHAPNVVWPWEDPQHIFTLLSAQDALKVMRDAYVERHRLNSLILRLPMVYDLPSRRSDPLSVIAAKIFKASIEKVDQCQLPLHQDHLLSLLHAKDVAAIVAEVGVSDMVGDAEIVGPKPMKCSDVVALVAETVRFAGDVVFGQKVSPSEEDEPLRKVEVPIKISMEQGVVEILGSLVGAASTPEPPSAARPPRRRRAPAAAASKEK